MHKLGYGLIFWLSITYCIGQSNTVGISFEIKSGLSGQFFLGKVKKSIPFTTGASTSTYTTVGIGIPLIFDVSLNKWALEITPTFRYPKTKKWLVQRIGIVQEDERDLVLDIHISIIRRIQSYNNFLNNSWFGFGASILNISEDITGSYDVNNGSGWTKVYYSNMRMAGMHLTFGHSISKTIAISASIIYINGTQVKNKPNISFYLLGNIGVTYTIFSKS